MTSQPFAIASAANDVYLPLLKGLVRSIRSCPDGADVPIVVLDCGLGLAAHRWLADHTVAVVTPGWDYAFASAMPEYFKAMVARPHLPRYVPDCEVILWLDADCWVQDWAAVALLLRGAARDSFAIVPELDRSYTPFYAEASYVAHLDAWYRACFDAQTAQDLCFHPLLNCGVFAARRDAPHWGAWANLLSASFERAVLFVSEQIALNVALRTQNLPVSLLPATCNWICHRALPRCSEDGRLLLEPQLPHAPLGIVHLAGFHHLLKDAPHDLRTPAGRTVRRALVFDR